MLSEEVEFYTKRILNELGVKPNLKGYRAWVEVSKYVIEKDSKHCKICNDIYPEVAKRMNDTPVRVERALRTSISGEMKERIKKYFATKCSITNGSFLGLLIQKIKELNYTATNEKV